MQKIFDFHVTDLSLYISDQVFKDGQHFMTFCLPPYSRNPFEKRLRARVRARTHTHNAKIAEKDASLENMSVALKSICYPNG